MSGLRKPVTVTLLALFWPSWAFAQSAGVVTTLAGQATVARAALPQPAPLKFKDEVFVRDTIRTQERSVVRMLLGGKALVTVRELSVFTITEEQGRSTVDLEAGKLALSVARQRMRPGEVIELRTPNAIAGVRGTVVIAEIIQASAQAPPGPGRVPAIRVTTNWYVLRGSIGVVPRGIPGAPPITVGQLQALSITGNTPGLVRAIPPGQLGQILLGLKSGPQHQDTPEDTKKQVGTKEHAKASALAALIAPEPAAPAKPKEQQAPSEQQKKEDDKSATTTTTETTTTTTITTQADPSLVAASAPVTTTTTTTTTGTTTTTTTETTKTNAPIIPTVETTTGPPDIPSVPAISNTTKTLASTDTLLTFPTGTAVQQQANTLVSISDSTVTQSSSGDLILSPAGSDSTIIGRLLDVSSLVSDSKLIAGSHLLRVAGSLTVGNSADLMRTDPTHIHAPNLVQIDATGSLTVLGSLLTDVGGTLTVSGDVTTVFGTLTSGPATLYEFSSTTVNAGTASGLTHFFRVNGSSGVATMSGPLVTTSGGSFTQEGSGVFEVSKGAKLTSTTSSPFMDFSGGSLTLGSGVIGVRIETGSTATLTGNLFRASGTALDVSGSGEAFIEVSSGSTLTVGGGVSLSDTSMDLGTEPLIRLFNASTLEVTATPLLKLTNATLTAGEVILTEGSGNTAQSTGTAISLTDSTLSLGALTSSDSVLNKSAFTLSLNEPLVELTSSTLTTTKLDKGGPTLGNNQTVPTEPGVALVATGTVAKPSTINTQGTLLRLEAGDFTATDPLVQLDHTTVDQTVTTNPLIQVDFLGKSGTMEGALLKASDNPKLAASSMVAEFRRGSLTSNGTGRFLTVDRSPVTTARNLILVTDGFALALKGSLLGAEDTIFDVTSSQSAFFAVTNGAKVTMTGTSDPLLNFIGTAPGLSKVKVSGELINIVNGAVSSASTAPLVKLSNTSVTTGSAVASMAGRSTVTTTETDPMGVDASGAALVLGTDVPLSHGGVVLETTGATVNAQKVLILDAALLAATAPLLALKPDGTTQSVFTTALDAINLQNQAKLTSVGPIVTLDNSTLTITSGALVNVAGGSFLKVTGNLISLTGTTGSTLTISNGPVLSVSGGSVVSISGGLIGFGTSSGNTVNVTNSLSGTTCSSCGGLNVAFSNGASSSQVSITSPIKNQGSNSMNITGAAISVSGTSAKVTVSGN